MYFKYHVNLDERGDFQADVRDPDGETVFEINDYDHLWEMVDCGYMNDKRDLDGLHDYLSLMGIIQEDDRLVTGN